MASNILIAFICMTINLSQQQFLHDTSLQFHTLNISYPIKTHGGIGAIYNNVLYGFSGVYCETSSLNKCESFTKYIEYTLDISSIHIDNNSKEIHLTQSPLWITTTITTTKINAIHLGTGTSSSTYLNEYAWILHPGCCTEPTGVALKYSLIDNKYINESEYDSSIPGQNLSDSCNTHDGTYIYCIGGRNGKLQQVSNKVYGYDILLDIWEELGDLNTARFGASCTFVNDKLYVLGGGGWLTGSKLKTIEVYIYEKKEWNIIEATLNTERHQHISVTHPNNWIITIGGRDKNNEAAITELFDPITTMIRITETMYSRKQFFHVVYEYDINTYVLFLWGGNFNGIVFDDIQYIVLSKNDVIFSTYTTTIMIETTDSNGNDKNNDSEIQDSILGNISVGTLIIILICIGGTLLMICILILICMVYSRKNNTRRTSRIYSPTSHKSHKSAKSSRIQRLRFVPRLEGSPKLMNKARTSSEGIVRKHAIDEETHKYIDNGQELNKLINNYNKKQDMDVFVSGSEHEDSSIEKMYAVSVEDEDEQKITPKNTRGNTYDLDGEISETLTYSEEKDYDWICNTLKKCDKKDWKIYLKNFKKNKVTENRLIHVNDDAVWEELLPELGVRVQFQQLWMERKMRKGYKQAKP